MRLIMLFLLLTLPSCALFRSLQPEDPAALEIREAQRFEALVHRRCGPSDPDEFSSREKCEKAWHEECVERLSLCISAIDDADEIIEVMCRSEKLVQTHGSSGACAQYYYSQLNKQEQEQEQAKEEQRKREKARRAAREVEYVPGNDPLIIPDLNTQIRLNEIERQQRIDRCMKQNSLSRVHMPCG